MRKSGIVRWCGELKERMKTGTDQTQDLLPVRVQVLFGRGTCGDGYAYGDLDS